MNLVTALTRLFKRNREKPSNQPSGPALDGARTIAFACSSAGDAEGQDWIAKAEACGAEIDVLPLSPPHRRADGTVLSFAAAPPRPAYDCVVVGQRITLFEHSWSYAFLDRLNSLLAADGTILIPRCVDPTRQIPDARLKALFGRTPRRAGERYLAFAKAPDGLRRPADAAMSTLDAYWPLMDAFSKGVFEERLGDVALALGADRIKRRSPNPSDDPIYLLNSQSYRTCSVRNKAAMVQHFADIYFPTRRDLRLVDLGAGTGLNSIELLLNPSRVAHVTLVEPNRSYHWDIAAMVDRLGPRVAGKVALAPMGVEVYKGAPCDIGMICGVFSILDQKTRAPFLDSAWSNLAPGGILAVLENMRLDDAVRGGAYNDQRFVPEEIDAFLGRLGPIRYFRSDVKKGLLHAQVGNATVWRVIRKTSA